MELRTGKCRTKERNNNVYEIQEFTLNSKATLVFSSHPSKRFMIEFVIIISTLFHFIEKQKQRHRETHKQIPFDNAETWFQFRIYSGN